MRAFKAPPWGLGQPGIWLVFAIAMSLMGAKTANATDPTCLTKEEARQKFPKAHLYWHTQHRCWDATPPGRANRADYKRRISTIGQAVAAPIPQYRVVIPPDPVRVVIPPDPPPVKRSFTPWDERVDGAFARARDGAKDGEEDLRLGR
jgi:hypothetical protein